MQQVSRAGDRQPNWDPPAEPWLKRPRLSRSLAGSACRALPLTSAVGPGVPVYKTGRTRAPPRKAAVELQRGQTKRLPQCQAGAVPTQTLTGGLGPAPASSKVDFRRKQDVPAGRACSSGPRLALCSAALLRLHSFTYHLPDFCQPSAMVLHVSPR